MDAHFSPRIQTIAAYPAPVSALNLLPELSRADYKKYSGMDAPTFDPSVPWIKNWSDQSALGRGSITYGHYVPNSTGSGMDFVSFTMTEQQAMTPNMIGTHVYEPWIVAPTNATSGSPAGVNQPVNPAELSTRDQADTLAAEIGGGAAVVDMSAGNGLAYAWADENRRRWAIQTPVPFAARLVGQLLQIRFAHGVGFPGQWVATASGLQWIDHFSLDLGFGSNKPLAPMPQRILHPDEVIKPVLFAGMQVQSVAAQSTTGQLVTPAGDLSMINVKLDRIANMLRQIGPNVGVTFS